MNPNSNRFVEFDIITSHLVTNCLFFGWNFLFIHKWDVFKYLFYLTRLTQTQSIFSISIAFPKWFLTYFSYIWRINMIIWLVEWFYDLDRKKNWNAAFWRRRHGWPTMHDKWNCVWMNRNEIRCGILNKSRKCGWRSFQCDVRV